ncbi:type 2 periplasmic-binding domain-containing protein [Nocardia aurantiaca]|uniref:Uncharacterized protein n=1 Tax=Nocardia aurantiaca TaxID=2675850 RepID=A0A6I3L4Z9_9NOCA|nr:hypothetical protein [Nocardia aurantiaca]MTE16030.1 hypothetical protein [Nocardia aurantiaca]
MWAGRSAATEFDDPASYPEPSPTRQLALRALRHAGRTCGVIYISDNLLGLRAAGGARGDRARGAVLPDGLVPLTDPELAELGDLDFMLMHRRTRPSDPEQALANAIVANARLLSHQTTRSGM